MITVKEAQRVLDEEIAKAKRIKDAHEKEHGKDAEYWQQNQYIIGLIWARVVLDR